MTTTAGSTRSPLPANDTRILRELGRRKAEIAALPVQQERSSMVQSRQNITLLFRSCAH